MPLERRLRKVIEAGLCTNCFSQAHKLSSCTSRYRCSKCGDKHHTMLHDGDKNAVAVVPNVRSSRPRELHSATSRAAAMTIAANVQLLLLPTVRCSIVFGSRRIGIRALLNTASFSSLISFNELKAAGIQRRVGDRINVVLCSLSDTQQRVDVVAEVVQSLQYRTPSAAVPQALQDRVKFLKVADSTFGVPGPVQMVLGIEVYHNIVMSGVLKPPGCPLAQETIFGYTLSGPFN